MPKPTLFIEGSLVGVDEETNKKVPIDHILDTIEHIRDDPSQRNVLVLKAETGAGKTVTVPAELYMRFKQPLVCTQPRVLTAKDKVHDILKIPRYAEHLTLGKTIGYQTKAFTDLGASVLFCTIGILYQQLLNDSTGAISRKYQFIVIDEVHERSAVVDGTLLLLNKMLDTYGNASPFVVVMSATIDVEKFTKYLKTGNSIDVIGAVPKIVTRFLEFDASDAVQSTIKTVEEIIMKDEKISEGNDIMIFIPDTPTMNAVELGLQKLQETIDEHYKILKIRSAEVKLQTGDYHDFVAESLDDVILTSDPDTGEVIHPDRLIVITTNVAETGVTKPMLRYVIDLGFHRSVSYNPQEHAYIDLPNMPTPKSMGIQRRGRAGRTFPGVYYPQYTKKTHDALPDMQHPEIWTSDITSLLLSTYIIMGVKPLDVYDIDWLDPPFIEQIEESNTKLLALGFINIDGPTEIGKTFGKIQMSPESIKMILAGVLHDICIVDLITIATCLNFFSRPQKLPKGTMDIPDDFIGMLYYFERQITLIISGDDHGTKQMEEIVEARDDYIEGFISCGLNVYSGRTLIDDSLTYLQRQQLESDYKKCILDGYYLNKLRIVMHSSPELLTLSGRSVAYDRKRYEPLFRFVAQQTQTMPLSPTIFVITDKITIKKETYSVRRRAGLISTVSIDGRGIIFPSRMNLLWSYPETFAPEKALSIWNNFTKLLFAEAKDTPITLRTPVSIKSTEFGFAPKKYDKHDKYDKHKKYDKHDKHDKHKKYDKHDKHKKYDKRDKRDKYNKHDKRDKHDKYDRDDRHKKHDRDDKHKKHDIDDKHKKHDIDDKHKKHDRDDKHKKHDRDDKHKKHDRDDKHKKHDRDDRHKKHDIDDRHKKHDRDDIDDKAYGGDDFLDTNLDESDREI
uniref:Helicase ATP-binding domain-containing protein n=1 Tax=viral metagenome TaxID=1070528 RepID=A0A6C0IU74_9ZZZZ